MNHDFFVKLSFVNNSNLDKLLRTISQLDVINCKLDFKNSNLARNLVTLISFKTKSITIRGFKFIRCFRTWWNKPGWVFQIQWKLDYSTLL